MKMPRQAFRLPPGTSVQSAPADRRTVERRSHTQRRESLVPAAAVTPAPPVNVNVVALEKLVVEALAWWRAHTRCGVRCSMCPWPVCGV